MLVTEEQLTTIHECGHAVAAFDLGLEFTGVTITATDETLGSMSHREDLVDRFVELGQIGFEQYPGEQFHLGVKSILVSLAGSLTVDAWVEAHGHEVPDDWYHGAELDLAAAALVAGPLTGSADEAGALLDWLRVRAAGMVSERSFLTLVDRLAPVLLERGTLTGREALDAMTIRRLPEGLTLGASRLPHDRLCQTREDGEMCLECAQIATVRADERHHAIEIIQEVADNDPTRARILLALQPSGDWVELMVLADE